MKSRFGIILLSIGTLVAFAVAVDAKITVQSLQQSAPVQKPVGSVLDKYTRNFHLRLVDQKVLDEVNRVLIEENRDRKPLTMADYDQLLDESYDRVEMPVSAAIRDDMRAQERLERAEQSK